MAGGRLNRPSAGNYRQIQLKVKPLCRFAACDNLHEGRLWAASSKITAPLPNSNFSFTHRKSFTSTLQTDSGNQLALNRLEPAAAVEPDAYHERFRNRAALSLSGLSTA